MSPQEFYSRRIETRHIISGQRRLTGRKPHLERYSRIIRREDVRLQAGRVRLVGGEPADLTVVESPAVVLEQDHGRLVRIIVTCPCGRHAELACEE